MRGSLLRSCLRPIFLLLALGPAWAGTVLGDDINDDEAHDYNGMPRMRLALETGYSQWIFNPGGLTPSYERYINTLETGWDYSAQAAWFPWAKGGIGAEWIWFLSKAEGDGVLIDTVGTRRNLRERASAVYYGPVFLSRVRVGRFGLLVGAFGAGLLDFRDAWTSDGVRNVVEARTLAVVPQVGWEYSFYRLVGMGINARAVLADLKEYTFNGKRVKIEQPDDPHSWSSIGLSRFELNAGFRFGLD